MARVLLDHVSKLYDKTSRPAVDRVSLEVHDEEFVVLVGPSGCGKTTTLRMIAGLEEISSGEITIGDRVVNDIAPSQRDIAMIFQNYALYPHFTVYKNIAFPLKNRRVPRTEIDKRVREVAQKLGLIDLLDRKPRQLSGGQRQRVAVGRAMVRDPAVFLFDEPLSNLDAKMRVTMRNEIKRLHRDLKATMVYVTHDQVEAMTMGDRIVVMNDGRVQQIDDPKTLYDRPQNMFVAGFIGSPPMNLLEGRIESDGAQMRFRSGAVEFSVPAPVREKIRARKLDSVVFGIRPEDAEELPRLGAGRDGTDESDWATFEGTVLNRETLGHEVVLYLDAGMEALVARVSSESQAAMGERHKLYLNLGKSHFFDPSSGERI